MTYGAQESDKAVEVIEAGIAAAIQSIEPGATVTSWVMTAAVQRVSSDGDVSTAYFTYSDMQSPTHGVLGLSEVTREWALQVQFGDHED